MAECRREVSAANRLVLNANILLRAIFGVRALNLLQAYEEKFSFYTPDVCFEDAGKYLPKIAKRSISTLLAAWNVLDQVRGLVHIIDQTIYDCHKDAGLRRICLRDAADWPIHATALLVRAPIRTKDQDFFGCGTATWTTQTVEVYFKDTPA